MTTPRAAAELFLPAGVYEGYYVSAENDGRYALVDGPHATHDEALALVDTIRRAYCERDAWGDFYGWGTTKLTAKILPERHLTR